MAHRLATAQWWVLVATVVVTPLAMSTWTLDVFNLAALTVVWFGVTVACGIEVALGFPSRRLPWLAPAVGMYVLILALSTVTSRAPVVSALGNYGRYGGLATTLPIIVLALLLAATAAESSRHRRQLAGAVVVSAVVGSAMLWVQQVDVTSVFGWQLPSWVRPWIDEPRHPPGLLGNSNFSGAHAALGIGPAVALARRDRRMAEIPDRARSGRPARSVAAWVWGGAAAVCATGVAITQSRGAIAATLTSLAAIAWVDERWRRVVIAAVAGAVVIGVMAATPPAVWVGALALLVAAGTWRASVRRAAVPAVGGAVIVGVGLLVAPQLPWIGDEVDELLATATWDERVDLWEVALDGAAERPLLGGGPDLYEATFADHAGPSLAGVVSDEPHNVVLDQLDGSGLLGAAAWLVVVAAAVETARHAARRSELLPWAAMGVGYVTQAMVSIDVVPLQLWGWAALAGIVAAADPRLGLRRVRRPHLATAVVAGVAVAGTLVLAAGPFRADMAHRRGIEASNAGDDVRALAELRLAVDRHGWEPRFHRRLGIQLTLAANATDDAQLTGEARAELEQTLDLLPSDPVARDWLASLDD